MSFSFDGPNKLIILTSGTTSFEVKDLYSRWKDWVQLSDNSKYVYAFTSVAGDPIGSGQSIAPYIFLNTTDGWRIRPQEADHELRVTGNLYSIDPNLPLFVPTTGDFTVLAIIERSSAAIAITVGGIDQATVQAAMTAQGYTTSRAPSLDNIDVAISTLQGQGLTSQQTTMLLEMYRLLGLDPTKPLVVDTPTNGSGYRRVPANGSEINQTIEKTGTTTTVTRV
jgi:hypothetical protein